MPADTEGRACASPLYISDLSRCMPASALADRHSPNHWTLISYSSDEVSGVMIGAGSMANAPQVSLPLNVSGWHSIHVGLWNPNHDYDGPTLIKMKLTGDPCFQPISTRNYVASSPLDWRGSDLLECFLRHADLTGKDVIVAQQTKDQAPKAYLAYVKLLPLSKEEVDAIGRDRARRDTRIVIASNDAASSYMTHGYSTKEELLEQVELFRYSDVGKLLYCMAFGDLTAYPSRIGQSLTDAVRSEDITACPTLKTMIKSYEALHAQGVDPAEVVLEHVHSLGVEFHAAFRLAVLGDIPPSQSGYNGIARQNPELRMVARDGTPVEKASYAFPETRERMVSIIREVAENYDIDGVDLCCVRGPQFVGYERPVVEDFKKRHGQDPRALDQNDPLVLQHRAGYFTEFVRQVRQTLREVEGKRGRGIELSGWIFSESEKGANLFYGVDVQEWLRENLVDSLIDPGSPEEFSANIKASGCKYYRQVEMGALNEVVDYHDRGVDGFVKWDLSFDDMDQWAVMRRLGHLEEAKTFARQLPSMKKIRLRSVNGYDICHPANVGASKRHYSFPEMLPFYSNG